MVVPHPWKTSLQTSHGKKFQQRWGTSFVQYWITTKIEQLSFVWFPSLQTTQTLAVSVTGPPPAAVPGCWSPQFINCLTLALHNSQKVAVFSPIFFLEILENHRCAHHLQLNTEEPFSWWLFSASSSKNCYWQGFRASGVLWSGQSTTSLLKVTTQSLILLSKATRSSSERLYFK